MSKLHELLIEDASNEDILALIANGADVNEANAEDCYMRPLQLAVNCKRSEQIIRALVNAGVDVNACATEDDLTEGDREAVEDGMDMGEMFDYWSDLTPMWMAASNKDTATIALLADLGANANLKCRCGTGDETAPIAATNDKDTLEALIKAGANVNLTYGDDAANKLGWDLEQLSAEALMTLLHAGAGIFGDSNPADRINSYIENHPTADGDLIRSLISSNSLEHFGYTPFGEGC